MALISNIRIMYPSQNDKKPCTYNLIHPTIPVTLIGIIVVRPCVLNIRRVQAQTSWQFEHIKSTSWVRNPTPTNAQWHKITSKLANHIGLRCRKRRLFNARTFNIQKGWRVCWTRIRTPDIQVVIIIFVVKCSRNPLPFLICSHVYS